MWLLRLMPVEAYAFMFFTVLISARLAKAGPVFMP
jgi:hypothetical protein